MFQYPRADRLIVGAGTLPIGAARAGKFQYPRADRLIVGVMAAWNAFWNPPAFQYPRADRLIVGARRSARCGSGATVSVSSCGSTYCWGRQIEHRLRHSPQFQYPRADRLIVGGV